jgi:hypothetical protein
VGQELVERNLDFKPPPSREEVRRYVPLMRISAIQIDLVVRAEQFQAVRDDDDGGGDDDDGCIL